MQSSDSNAAVPAERPQREIGAPWSLLLIPVLLLAGAVSVPISSVAARIRRRRERAFRERMLQCGRIMGWAEFQAAIAKNDGTLIEERYSFKGPVRWWWNADNVYEICPHPMVDWMAMLNNPTFRATTEWFHHQYTDPEKGRAFLVVTDRAVRDEIRAIRSELKSESGRVRWIEVAPPKNGRRHR